MGEHCRDSSSGTGSIPGRDGRGLSIDEFPGSEKKLSRKNGHAEQRILSFSAAVSAGVCGNISLREAETGEACKIGPHDIEEILYSSIPRNQHGNLIADLGSELRTWLAGKRISRQRLHLLLHDETEPTRYDLMTLRFLCLAVNPEQQEDVKTRYNGYVEDMNHILTDCGFQEIYLADPYESFLLMCVLSSDPLGTYADVIELSYQEGLEGGSSS